MAEAEKRLMQLKEKECHFEEALREKERKVREESSAGNTIFETHHGSTRTRFRCT